ncbi:site-specific integrase, partial [Streptomyces sp. F001]
MSGCGMRNGEAFAVSLDNIVADDVYRITEQVNRTTCQYERVKHRKPGEYGDVPLPARVRQSIEWYADKHGTVDGYLLRHPGDPTRTFPRYHIANQWQRIKKAGQVDIPDGIVVYGLRHFFASNCLAHGIPITDVAEWMGHNRLAAQDRAAAEAAATVAPTLARVAGRAVLLVPHRSENPDEAALPADYR